MLASIQIRRDSRVLRKCENLLYSDENVERGMCLIAITSIIAEKS